MKKTEKTIETPRGTFKMHTEFASLEEAKEHGWGYHFTHEGFEILTKDNHVGAIVNTKGITYSIDLDNEIDGLNHEKEFKSTDGTESVVCELEDWVTEQLEDDGLDVYEVTRDHVDSNCYTMEAWGDDGEKLGFATITTNEF